MSLSLPRIRFPSLDRELFLEVSAVGFCLFSGILGLSYVFDTQFWNRLSQNSLARVHVGTVNDIIGAVRMRHEGSLAWVDMERPLSVSVGDTFFTGKDGHAKIALASGTQIDLQPNSLITIREERQSASAMGWNFLAAVRPSLPFLQVHTGTTRVHIAKGSTFKLKAASKEYNLAGEEEAPAALEVRVAKEVTLSAQRGSAISVEEPQSPSKPAKRVEILPSQIQPISPLSGEVIRAPVLMTAGFKSKPAVEFAWDGALTAAHQPSIEIDGDSAVSWKLSNAEISASRAMRSVEAGTYRWRLKAESGAPPTEWIDFRVQEISAPALLGPAQDAVIPLPGQGSQAQIRLGWETLSEDLHVEVELTLNDGSPRLIQGDSTEAKVSLKPGRYLWRARSVYPIEGISPLRSAWSETRAFEIAKGPTEAVSPLISHAAVTQSPPPVTAAPEAPPAKDLVKAAAALKTAAIEQKKAIKSMPPDVVKVLPRSTDKAVDTFAAMPSLAVMPVSANTRLQSESDLDHMKIALRWSPIRGVSAYSVKVGETDGSLLMEKEVQEPFLLLTLTSIGQKAYYYEVRAKVNGGREISSGHVPIKIEIIPPTPKLPAQGTKVDGAEPVLITWVSTALTQIYYLEVSQNPHFEKAPTLEVSKNFYLFNASSSGTWYWRVRAGSGRLKSGWSKPSRFLVKNSEYSGEDSP